MISSTGRLDSGGQSQLTQIGIKEWAPQNERISINTVSATIASGRESLGGLWKVGTNNLKPVESVQTVSKVNTNFTFFLQSWTPFPDQRHYDDRTQNTGTILCNHHLVKRAGERAPNCSCASFITRKQADSIKMMALWDAN